MENFRNIGVMGRADQDRADADRAGQAQLVDTLRNLTAFLLARNLNVILDEGAAAILSSNGLQVSSRKQIGEVCDLVVVVGGDGSMLSAARDLCKYDVAVLGINRGRLGFLTDVSPLEIESRLTEILEGKYETEDRFLLDAVVKREGEPVGKGTAFNDVVVSSGEVARMIEFETYIEGSFVYSQRSDGLILSTPTGSTAYSLSGGGPIMHPKLDVMLLTPMFPHSLSSRPIVVDGNCEIKIVIGQDNYINPVVTCDGYMKLAAQPGDKIYIHKRPHKIRMIHPLGHNFYTVCRDKLGWGNRLGK